MTDLGIWADALASVAPLYAIVGAYHEQQAEIARQQEEGRFWVLTRLARHMDVAIDVWKETRSQEAVLDAWVHEFEPDFAVEKVAPFFGEENCEDVWNFTCGLAAQMVRQFCRPTVWDHLRNPAL